MTNQTNHTQGMPKVSALAQFAQTFGSLDELIELFDNLLSRITSAYSGSTQSTHDLAGDYDFVHQLKQAIKADLKGIALKFTPAPYYSNMVPFANIPRLTNAPQAVRVAEAKGIKDFRAIKIDGEYVLLTNWSKGEVIAYDAWLGTLEGSFSDEGKFMLRFLKQVKSD